MRNLATTAPVPGSAGSTALPSYAFALSEQRRIRCTWVEEQRFEPWQQQGRKLVIVESPAKAKTIAGYLGKDYDVEASVGHIRDLPNPVASCPPT